MSETTQSVLGNNFNKQKYTSCQWGEGNGFFVVNKQEKAIFKKFLSFEHSNGDTSHAKLGTTSLYPNTYLKVNNCNIYHIGMLLVNRKNRNQTQILISSSRKEENKNEKQYQF